MDARAYGVAQLTGISSEAGDQPRTADLNAARGMVLGLGVSAIIWALLLMLLFVSIF